MARLKFDGKRWVAHDTDGSNFQRLERQIERREGDHFLAGVLVGFAGGGVLTTMVLALGELFNGI